MHLRIAVSLAVPLAALVLASPASARGRDSDHDGLSNRLEHRHHTNPHRKDTDRDGLKDGAEVHRYHTNPRRKDTDRDGFSDRVEVRAHTNPRNRNSHPGAGSAASGQASPAVHCDIGADPSSFRAAVSRAAAGQTVCLASGRYGTWSGTNKAITVAAAPGATPTMDFDFDTGAGGFTLDGISGLSGDISNSARNITIRNSAFDDTTKIEGVENGNILFDHDTFNNIGCDSGCLPRLWLAGGTRQPSGVTVQNSQFIGGSSDGIQAGTALNVLHNEFANIVHGGCDSCHTDNIQLYSGQADNGVGSVIRGNYIHDGETGIVQFDGGGGNDVEDNVIARMSIFGMDFGGDRGTKIIHNTEYAIEGAGLDLTSKAGQNSSGEIVRDNVLKNISLTDSDSDARPAVNADNMLLYGGGGSNFRGAPAFASPTSYLGFLLRAGSAGIGRASDGGNVGIRP
jgi:hypothetical protein